MGTYRSESTLCTNNPESSFTHFKFQHAWIASVQNTKAVLVKLKIPQIWAKSTDIRRWGEETKRGNTHTNTNRCWNWGTWFQSVRCGKLGKSCYTPKNWSVQYRAHPKSVSEKKLHPIRIYNEEPLYTACRSTRRYGVTFPFTRIKSPVNDPTHRSG